MIAITKNMTGGMNVALRGVMSISLQLRKVLIALKTSMHHCEPLYSRLSNQSFSGGTKDHHGL